MQNPSEEQIDLMIRLYPDFTRQQAKEILVVMDMKDEDIDLSDIPEIKEIPKDAVRGLFYRGPMIRLKPELHRYFCELADRKRVPMADLVNETLEKALAVTEVMR
jgi:hypothetical protein